MTHEFNLPRPEYPRPERRRGTIEGVDWLNLNGPWQFRFDGDRRGQELGWHAPDDLEWREQIIVPFCWESLAAWGEGDTAGNDNYYSIRPFRNPLDISQLNHRSAERYEVGWYRRWIEIPTAGVWKDRRIILTIGAADFFTDCWCNGTHLGHHEGGYTPFEFDLTDALIEQDGKRLALLVIRVEDPVDNHEQPVGKQWRWYTTVSGIWQTVFIEPRSRSHIRSFRMTPDVDSSSAHFRIQCAEPPADSQVVMEIAPPDHPVLTTTVEVRDGVAEVKLPIEPLLLWNPNDPSLYELTLHLESGGQRLDTIFSYFGMRKFDAAPSEDSNAPAVLRLNGVQRYLRGALYQSYHPDGVYTAGSVEALKTDILAAKKAGFNFLRVHIKIDDPLLLHYADTLGMLIMADFPNFGEGGDTPVGRRRFEEVMREAIERDFNHPCIFAWCMFNETWGFGGQSEFVHLIHPVNPKQRPAQAPPAPSTSPAKAKEKLAYLPSQAWVQRMWELAKRLDTTRLIEDMSVCHWEHLDYCGHGDTDVNSWHFYINDYERARKHIETVVKSTYAGSSWNYVPGYEHKGQPLINSEYGGIGALDGDCDVSWSFKFLTNELRRYGQISAYVYTQHHDVEWEHNGFLNYDRTVKDFGYDLRMINESNQLPVDAPPISKVKPGQRISVSVSSSHFSSRAQRDVSLVWRLHGVDTRGRHYQDITRGIAPIPFTHLRVAPAHEVAFTAPKTPMLCILLVQAFTKDGECIAQNFVHFHVSDGYPPLREETPRALVLRASPGNWQSETWTRGTNERSEQTANDFCHGIGHGYFQWDIPIDADLSRAQRLRILCEASSHRTDNPQTDDDVFPTTLQISLNEIRVYEATLQNHPHDARGVLSYLRGGKGAYGYLVHALAEEDLLQKIAQGCTDNHLRLRLGVPKKAMAQGGLTVYGAECGRFPVCPTIVVEW